MAQKLSKKLVVTALLNIPILTILGAETLSVENVPVLFQVNTAVQAFPN